MTITVRNFIPVNLLQSTIQRAHRVARNTGTPTLASQTVPLDNTADPLTFFGCDQMRFEYRSYWEIPSEHVCMVGLGTAIPVRSDSIDRFQIVAEEIRDIVGQAIIESSGNGIQGPVFLGGFRFDPERSECGTWPDSFAPGLLTLPRFMLSIQNNVNTFTVNCLVEPDIDVDTQVEKLINEIQMLQFDESRRTVPTVSRHVNAVEELPAKEDWKQKVVDATKDIQSGRFKKIVLAHQLNVDYSEQIEAVSVLEQLRDNNPTARIFAFSLPGGCFVGASPELLAKRTNGYVEVSCLAGSTPRGGTPERDAEFGRELQTDEKNLFEHDIVARQIHEVLDEVCDEVEQGELGLMQLPTVQHLHTPFRGHLLPNSTLLDVVGRLHPTPAVGAYPQRDAISEIGNREGIDRGWYAGPVGWIGADGRGEFAVALRSGLLVGNRATLFAGCGIVGDSDPEAEYEEAALKLRPVLTALEPNP